MASRSLARLLHTSSRYLRNSSAPSTSSGSHLVWDVAADRWIRKPRAASARQQALQELVEREKERREQELPPEQLPELPKALLNEAENAKPDEAATRKSYQERKYRRGQDDSTLKVQVGGAFEGVPIPVRPIAPPYDTCCMSGCPRCVYDVYTRDMELYQQALAQARTDLDAKGISKDLWPQQLHGSATGVQNSDSSTDSAEDRASQEVDWEIKNLDITLRTFLQFERQLRRRRTAEKSKSIAMQHVSQFTSSSLTA